MLSDEWFAGFFDGEGSITIGMLASKARMERYGHPIHLLHSTVSNTNREVLELFTQRFAGSIAGPFTRKDRPGQAPIFEWHIHGANAEALLETIGPYLIIKREQAKLALEFQRSKKRSRVLPPDEIIKREALRQRMIALNAHKGPIPRTFAIPTKTIPLTYEWVKRGEQNPRAKLTWETVREIRRRSAAGEKRTPLAEEFGVDPSQVDHIVRNEQWKEPTGGP